MKLPVLPNAKISMTERGLQPVGIATRRLARVLGLLACAVTVTGCAMSGSGSTPSTPSEPFVVISPEEANLAQASRALTARVGHLVTYDVDADVVKEYAPRFLELLTDGLARVALGVDAARTRDPEAAAHACLVLSVLKLEIDAKAREPYARFEPKRGMLVLKVPTQGTALVSENTVAAALTAAE